MNAMPRVWWSSVVLWTLLLVACGSPYGDPPGAGSGGQFRVEGVNGWPEPEVMVFVVDDWDDEEGAKLREALASAVRSHEWSRPSCLTVEDPAAWFPADRQALFVRPSASPDGRYAHAGLNPALRLVSVKPTAGDEQRWAAAVEGALLAKRNGPGVYRPLHVLSEVAALLGGWREPADELAQEVEANVAPDASVFLVLASAHEDESSGPVEQYVLPSLGRAPSGRHLRFASITLPSDPRSCASAPAEPRWRLEDWAEEQQRTASTFDDLARGWPCEAPGLSERAFADCTWRCMPYRLRIATDGSAQCRIHLRAPGLTCLPERGWLDPLAADGARRPRIDEDEAGRAVGVCEIVQLEGPDLDACRHDLRCPGCSPGWCATEVPELLDTCRSHEFPIPFRFVGGASYSRNSSMELICNYTNER